MKHLALTTVFNTRYLIVVYFFGPPCIYPNQPTAATHWRTKWYRWVI